MYIYYTTITYVVRYPSSYTYLPSLHYLYQHITHYYKRHLYYYHYNILLLNNSMIVLIIRHLLHHIIYLQIIYTSMRELTHRIIIYISIIYISIDVHIISTTYQSSTLHINHTRCTSINITRYTYHLMTSHHTHLVHCLFNNQPIYLI